MGEYLRGNYELKGEISPEPETTEQESVETEFYRRALEKLGGSIAFILKSKNLLWKGDQDDGPRD